jgi:hypothetical protein
MVNENNFLSINEVLADALVALDDEEQRMLTPGFYRAQVRNAMDELGFDTVFTERDMDVPIPSNNIVVFPQNAYRIKDVLIYTGSPDNVQYVQPVYWKKGARTEGYGKGYVANNHPGNHSDNYFSSNPAWGDNDINYFFSFVQGNIYLSDPCTTYDYVKVVFDGIASGTLDDTKMVPPEVRDAVMLWVIERCASMLKVKDAKYRTVQLDAAAQLDVNGFDGAWQKAIRRIKYQGKKIRKDIAEYNNRPRA